MRPSPYLVLWRWLALARVTGNAIFSTVYERHHLFNRPFASTTTSRLRTPRPETRCISYFSL
jgi:hypothetical protein